jgi:hypothetical protein
VDLAAVNKIGWRSERELSTNSKQYFLTAVFDPISEFSLGGSRELFVEDHGRPGHPVRPPPPPFLKAVSLYIMFKIRSFCQDTLGTNRRRRAQLKNEHDWL